ncbi:eCIS core domain-containing protein [Oryzomicrobium sp.]|uniref:eCIS core domain-containing protein n=1 Tax=Oryzomicrobium sp. TaxID=1911578 RepID=UPI002FE2293B
MSAFADRRSSDAESHMARRLQAAGQAGDAQFAPFSPKSPQGLALQARADAGAQVRRLERLAVAQRQGADEEETLQPKALPAQRVGEGDEEVPLQRRFTAEGAVGGEVRSSSPLSEAASPNRTGLPDPLKAGIEALSGISMGGVRVHYNSDKPAQLSALAFAQGSDIHVAPGQERHLPHEAWHVVQQAQGRVKPTFQMKGGARVNDDPGLEREADAMGDAALAAGLRVAQRLGPEAGEHRAMTPRAGLPGMLKAMSVDGIQHVAQRVVMPWPNPLVPLAGNTATKFNELINAMTGLPLGPAAGVDVMVHVDDQHVPNPAETRRSNLIGVDIEITLRKWYLDITSVGEIVALVAHELGVHDLADTMISRRARRRERRRNAAGTGFQVNVNGRVHGVAGWNAPVAHNWDAQGRQRDHVNVVRDAGGVAGNASARTRAYVDTMLSLGDQINAVPAVGPAAIAARQQKLRDLVQTFLFDYARILVTDEGGAWATFRDAGFIADVMNWYENVLVARHAAAHPWLPFLAGNATGWGLRGWLLGKLAAYFANRAGTMVRRAANWVGRSVAGAWRWAFG